MTIDIAQDCGTIREALEDLDTVAESDDDRLHYRVIQVEPGYEMRLVKALAALDRLEAQGRDDMLLSSRRFKETAQDLLGTLDPKWNGNHALRQSFVDTLRNIIVKAERRGANMGKESTHAGPQGGTGLRRIGMVERWSIEHEAQAEPQEGARDGPSIYVRAERQKRTIKGLVTELEKYCTDEQLGLILEGLVQNPDVNPSTPSPAAQDAREPCPRCEGRDEQCGVCDDQRTMDAACHVYEGDGTLVALASHIKDSATSIHEGCEAIERYSQDQIAKDRIAQRVSSACPVCGKDTPHFHTPLELQEAVKVYATRIHAAPLSAAQDARALAMELREMHSMTVCGEAWQELELDLDEATEKIERYVQERMDVMLANPFTASEPPKTVPMALLKTVCDGTPIVMVDRQLWEQIKARNAELRDEAEAYKVDAHIYSQETVKLRAEADALRESLNKLLCKVNRVTAAYRHGHHRQSISLDDLNDLCNYQIEVENLSALAAGKEGV